MFTLHYITLHYILTDN